MIKSSLDSGILEIMRYVPATLIKDKIEDMDLDTFARYLAKARYLEEVESNLYLQALNNLLDNT